MIVHHPSGTKKPEFVNLSGLHTGIPEEKQLSARTSCLPSCRYRGLSEWDNAKDWLTDTCLDGQDTFRRLLAIFSAED